jgi:outer membrane protein assembly factor BamB
MLPAASTETSHARRATPRWWLLFVICAVEAGWLLWVWQGPAIQRQEQVMKTAGGVLAGAALILIWLLVFSRLAWKIRWGVLLLAVCVIATGAATFRISGVTGDLVPILTPRWKSAPLTDHSGRSSVPLSPAASSESDRRLPEGFAGFPQFLGPTRDGIIHGPALARDWKTNEPRLLWRVSVGDGYSGFAIAHARVLSIEQLGDNEAVVCRDLLTGATLWTHEDAARFENSVGGIGPRTTPTISGDRVFVVGATGHLRALDLSSGQLIWQRDIVADAGTKAPDWGLAGSPLVVDDTVIVHPGGPGHSVAAYRAHNGDPIWAAGDARAGYSSPQLVTLRGVRQVLIFNHEGVAAHALTDGKELWSYPWTKAAQHVTDPRMVAPNRFVVSSGYGAGADLVEVSRDETGGWKTQRLWHSRRLKSKFASLVVRKGFLYGLDDGRITCIDLATGEPRWKGERVGHGQVLLAGDLLFVTAENGEVLLLEATAEAARELGRFEALPGKMWNPPALAPPYLIVRTEKEAACYELPLAQGAR